MKKILIPTFIVFASLVFSTAQATIFPISVTDFEEVNLKVPANVVWSDDDNPAAEMECNQETKDQLEFIQEGKSLTIKWKSNLFTWKDKSRRLVIKLQSSSLRKVIINGSGGFAMKNTNDSESFEYSINGSGELIAMISAKDCKGTINGSGNLNIGGKVEVFTPSINGSGDVLAFGLKAQSVEVAITGSGDAEVFVTDNLKVRITGSGDVKYKGEPKKIDQKVTGSGSIKKV